MIYFKNKAFNQVNGITMEACISKKRNTMSQNLDSFTFDGIPYLVNGKILKNAPVDLSYLYSVC